MDRWLDEGCVRPVVFDLDPSLAVFLAFGIASESCAAAPCFCSANVVGGTNAALLCSAYNGTIAARCAAHLSV